MTTYAFVDLGYLLREIDSFAGFVFPAAKELRPDMLRLKSVLGNASRVFIYYAAEQRANDGAGDPKHAERIAQQQRVIDWLGAVQRLEGVHVRWGDVKYKPRKKERIQKRVDVMLAVDMMKHAFRKTMDHAVLLTGDLDFHPLVEELVETGCHVTVATCRWSSAGALLDAADVVIELDALELLELLRDRPGAGFPQRLEPSLAPSMNVWRHVLGERGGAKFGDHPMMPRHAAARFGESPERIWTCANAELLEAIVRYEIDAVGRS